MSIKEQLTLAAGFAVLLSCAALMQVFDGGHWMPKTAGAVLSVVLTGLVSRRLGLPRPLQPLVGLLALAAFLVLAFASTSLTYGLLPGSRTYDVLRGLAQDGNDDIQAFGPPVPVSTGLVLLTAGGVGLVAWLVDLVAVVLDRAALAGLPLLLLFAVPSAVLPGGLGGLPFVLGAVGWLSLLMVEGSERVGRWGTPMRSALPGARPGGDDSSLGRVGRRIGFTALGAAVVVPLLVPGLDHTLVGGKGNGAGSGKGGGSNSARTYNPITTLKDQLTRPQPVELFQYRTTDPHPDYIRMTTLDRWTGAGWAASDLSALQKNAQVQKGIPKPVGDGGQHQDFDMKVVLTGSRLDVYWLPVPFGPTKVAVDGLWLWDPASQTVFSAKRSTKGLKPYDISASRVLPDRDALALAEIGGVPAEIRSKYGSTISVAPFVEQLTHQVTDSAVSAYDKAVALQAYFTDPKGGFTYDLQPSQPVGNEDQLEAFLRGKHGFCEQYATAMAAMLRVAGIPSRVGVGFTPGEKLDDKGAYSVTTSEAHAWPEAWFAGTGWVRFEPTPAANGIFAPDYTRAAAPTPNVPGVNPSTGPSTQPSPTASRRLNVPADDLKDTPTGPAATTTSSGPSPWLLLPVGVALLAVAPLALTWLRRRRRWLRPDALTAWAQLQDDATDVGFRWHPADSPRAGAAHLVAWKPLAAPAVTALDTVALAAERARYAPPGSAATLHLRAEVAVVRAALQTTAPLPVRLRAKYAPPSTVRWVAHTVGEAVADVLDKVDDVISATTRPLRRRIARAD